MLLGSNAYLPGEKYLVSDIDGRGRVAAYPPDDPGGFGPALQVVTDDGAMLMDSVTVLLHRLGVPFDVTVHDYFAICPQVNLMPWTQGAYCGEPAPAFCNACIADRPSPCTQSE